MYAIGKASRLSGVGIEAIRYYEREGVIPRAERTSSGRRRYSEQDVARLRFLRKCRDLGFSLPDAQALLQLSASGAADCASASGLGRRHLDSVRRKIAELRELERALDELMINCAAGNTECPMLALLTDTQPQSGAGSGN